MDLRSLLHPGATWILRTTPESTGESDGQIQEDFQRIGGPTGSQFPTPDVGGPVHRSGCDAVRGGRSFGHGAVRPFQGRAAAANPSTGAWHPEPRHLRTRVPDARPRSVRAGVPALHG